MPTPLKVLIIEDRPADAELMAYALERAGFAPDWQRVETEADYLVQLELNPDIILADHNLPDFNAPRALDLLKGRGLDIPLIVVTGSISEEVAVARIKQGAADYILKDRPTRLGPAVARALEEKGLRQERRAAQEAVLQLAAIVQSSDDAIIGQTLEGIITTWNKGAERIYGYLAEEAKGRPVSILAPPERADEMPKILERIKRGEYIDHFETVRIRKDGSPIHVSLAISPIKDAQGNIIGASSIARDINEQKRAAEVLSRLPLEEIQRKKSRALTDLVIVLPFGILLLVLSFYVAVFDAATELLLKYAVADEVVGLVVFLSFAFAFYSYRRWQDIKEQIFGRKKAEEALRTLHGELEIRVRERTSDLANANESLKAEIAQRKQAQEEIRRNLMRIRALHEIDLAITSTLDLRAILNVLLEKIEIFLPMAAASTVRLLNPKSGELQSLACRGLDEEEWRSQVPTTLAGRAERVVETKAPVVVRNISTDARTYDTEFFQKRGLVSYLGVPLIAHDEVLGVLSLYTGQEHEFSKEEVDFLFTLAGQGAIAIHNAQLYEKIDVSRRELELSNEYLEKSLKQLSGLYTALSPLTPTESFHMVLDGITERVTEATGADAVLIRVWDTETSAYLVAGYRGFPGYYLKRVATAPPGGAVDWVVEHGEPIIAPNIALETRFKGKLQLQLGFQSCALLPLKVHDAVRGIIHLASRKLGYFDEEQGDHLMAIARQMGIALENRELFDDLKASRDDLERANKVKDEFLSVMSHELRTPLSVVMGYVGMIKEGMLGEVDPKQKEALQKVLNRASDQLDMINEIMQTTQLEARAIGAQLERCDLRDLFDHLRSDYEIRAEKKTVRLIWDYPAAAMPMNTDAAKLKQILHNLIDNAIKFTDEGTVSVTARVTSGIRNPELGNSSDLQFPTPNSQSLTPNSRFVEFRVSDTGIGVPKEKFAAIFEKFYQVDSSATRLYGGVGLGLYIVKNFTELLGGTVRVESEPGKGSTFTVTAPVEH
jgi:PAS domain S-box-containing protein